MLQLATYFAEAEIRRLVARAAGAKVRLSSAVTLSVAKLFLDQALPSAGVSGTAMMATAFEQEGVPRPVVMAAVVVNTASYYAAYVLCLAAALIISVALGLHSVLLWATSIAFMLAGSAVAIVALSLAGRHRPGGLERISRRIPLLKRLVPLLEEANPALARSPRTLLLASAAQLAIILLDAATIWLLIHALGSAASVPGVFTSFMVSSLLRTLSIIPGGLGTFDAASVLTLKLVGVPVGRRSPRPSLPGAQLLAPHGPWPLLLPPGPSPANTAPAAQGAVGGGRV